jgi:hypothetical protein
MPHANSHIPEALASNYIDVPEWIFLSSGKKFFFKYLSSRESGDLFSVLQ